MQCIVRQNVENREKWQYDNSNNSPTHQSICRTSDNMRFYVCNDHLHKEDGFSEHFAVLRERIKTKRKHVVWTQSIIVGKCRMLLKNQFQSYCGHRLCKHCMLYLDSYHTAFYMFLSGFLSLYWVHWQYLYLAISYEHSVSQAIIRHSAICIICS